MINPTCFLHGGRNNPDDLARGHITKILRKNVEVDVVLPDGEEFWATIKKAKFYKPHQKFLTQWHRPGRYFGFKLAEEDGSCSKVYLCTCYWSKQDLIEADKRAKELYGLMQESVRHKPLAED